MRWTSLVRVAAAVAAVAVFALPAFSQGRASDFYVDEDAERAPRVFQPLRDFSAMGASMGVMKVFGGDLGERARISGIGQSIFRYRFNENWVGTGEFGFGWNSFEAGRDTVLAFTFGTLGAARKIGSPASIEMRLGFGAGLYRWNYKYDGRSIRDRTPGEPTHQFYRAIDFGGYVGLESERRLTRHVTLLAMLQHHYVMTADKDRFRSLFDKNHSFMSFRLGAAYHFSPYEGMLWERTGRTRIRLESGREGR